MDIPITMQFKCNKCRNIINHNYTQDDVKNNGYLELICSNCNFSQEISTKKLIQEAKEETIKLFKKNFKTR